MSESKLNTKIEYIDEGHIYLNDKGVIIPSCSDLIKFQYPDAYANIPERILKQKASYGSKVHDYVERLVHDEFSLIDIKTKRIDPNIKIALEQFELLRKSWAFVIKDMEQIVSYQGRYAGRYDMRTIDDYLIDIKTTTEIHEDWLSYQLGLYQLCLGLDKNVGYCMWLPKGKAGKVVAITPKSKEECLRLLERYEASGK